jgi:murein DD-endopeptidase MepM/ murein hydrolase activator NlpD
MRHAMSFVLLAAFGQSACTEPARRSPIVPQVPKAPECPAPKAGAAKEAEFDRGKPPLPDGLRCLRHPMRAHRKVSSEFMDPDHAFVPGRHSGTDMPAPVGTDVLAPAGGVVRWVREVAACQDAAVAVEFGDEWTYAVHHLSRVDVWKGEKVVRGQRLGLSGGAVDAPGSGPWTTGPHLHFSMVYRGAYVDAEKYFCP